MAKEKMFIEAEGAELEHEESTVSASVSSANKPNPKLKFVCCTIL